MAKRELAGEPERSTARAPGTRCIQFLGCRRNRGIFVIRIVGNQTLSPENVPHRIARLSADAEPVSDALLVDHHSGRMRQWIVVAQGLDNPAVARRAALGRHNPVTRAFLRAHAPESKFDHVRESPLMKRAAQRFDRANRKIACGLPARNHGNIDWL